MGAPWLRGRPPWPWPSTEEELARLQRALAEEADRVRVAEPWTPVPGALAGGCFVAFARGEAGPGRPGDRAWAAAVAWRPAVTPVTAGAGSDDRTPRRHGDRHLRGAAGAGPRRASDVEGQAVVAGRVPASYAPGLLALRDGPVLAAAVAALEPVPDVVLVDATGLDHPRGAGLAVHLGAAVGIATVGVTHRPLLAAGEQPPAVRGARSPLRLAGRTVGHWVSTRTGARPVAAHAGWRTGADTAAEVALATSTEAARTPVPLQEARRVAREARALSEP